MQYTRTLQIDRFTQSPSTSPNTSSENSLSSFDIKNRMKVSVTQSIKSNKEDLLQSNEISIQQIIKIIMTSLTPLMNMKKEK